MNKQIILSLSMVALLPCMALAQSQRNTGGEAHPQRVVGQEQKAPSQRGVADDKSPRARMADPSQQHSSFQNMLDDASALYAKVISGSQGEVPASVLSNARCIAILPGVVTGAFVIGGTHGDGLASCKVRDGGHWSHPAAITLSKGSIGLQAGVKSADLVLFFQSEAAERALKSGNLEIGTDVSAVAGNFDTAVNPSGAGVIVYTHSRGLFAGASINGSKIGKNQSELENYYGKKVDYRRVLDGQELSDTNQYAQNLINLFPSS